MDLLRRLRGIDETEDLMRPDQPLVGKLKAALDNLGFDAPGPIRESHLEEAAPVTDSKNERREPVFRSHQARSPSSIEGHLHPSLSIQRLEDNGNRNFFKLRNQSNQPGGQGFQREREGPG